MDLRRGAGFETDIKTNAIGKESCCDIGRWIAEGLVGIVDKWHLEEASWVPVDLVRMTDGTHNTS